MYITSRSNIVVACMHLFDCFMDDFYDEKYLEQISDLDIRAQLEVNTLILQSALKACTTHVPL